jgi:hypothetical protein
MTAIGDLERCSYFPLRSDVLLAVGWLGPDEPFQRGPVQPEFFLRLKELCANPWQPVASAGFHVCELCQFDGPRFVANLFVPYAGHIYVAPVGVIHYIATHWYCPPAVFVDAVLSCAPMNSTDYKRMLLENGGRDLLAVTPI